MRLAACPRSALAACYVIWRMAGSGGGVSPAADESAGRRARRLPLAEPRSVVTQARRPRRGPRPSSGWRRRRRDRVRALRRAIVEAGDPEYELVQEPPPGCRPSPTSSSVRERPGDRRPRRHRDLGGRSNQDEPDGPVAVVRTSQGFDELARDPGRARLRSATATRWSTREARVTEVADAGDGVDRAQRQGRRGRRPGRGAAGRAGGARRGRSSRRAERRGSAAVGLDDGCQTAFGGSERADARRGRAPDRASTGRGMPTRVDLKPLRNAGDRPGGARGRRDDGRDPVRGRRRRPSRDRINRVTASFAFADLYDCG